jgi:hypothetical protein
MHNDRENRICITAEDEAAIQHLHHLNHSHSDQDVDSNHNDSFDEHEHSDYSLEHRWDNIGDDVEDDNS